MCEEARPRVRDDGHESRYLASCSFHSGPGQHGRLSGLHRRLLPNLKETAVIYVTAAITALLFIHLVRHSFAQSGSDVLTTAAHPPAIPHR
jgi:H2-forming N5,N10-methylenetetrahydromethanopterin dehydrogenase-like enzyme